MFFRRSFLSKGWKVDVIVVRSGGRDAKGNPRPTQDIPRPGVLIIPRSTSDPVDRSDVVDKNAVLYDNDATFRYQSTDRIKVPDGARMAGNWAIEGDPSQWPSSSEMGLVRA